MFNAGFDQFSKVGNQSFFAGERVSLIGQLTFLKSFPNGWTIGRIKTDELANFGVTGNSLTGLTVNVVYHFCGLISQHPTYGLQLKVESATLHVPENKEGIAKFLRQNFKGVGKVAAGKIVSFHLNQPGGLTEFRKNLIANPYSMNFAEAGVKQKTSMDNIDGVRGMIYMDLATRIGGQDVGDKLLRRMAALFEPLVENLSNPVAAAWDILSSNPYSLIRSLQGYGFHLADSLAQQIGFDLTRQERLGALVTHAINEGCNANGHTYLTEDNFKQIIHAVDPTIDIQAALTAAQNMGEPLVVDSDRYYIESVYQAEMSLARYFCNRQLLKTRSSISELAGGDLENAIDAAQNKIGLYLDSSQRACVHGLLSSTNTVHTITAGPGCGKTTIIEVIVQLLLYNQKSPSSSKPGHVHSRNTRIGFCASTGKAAKVLSARVRRFGLRALTVHSLLGVRRTDSSDGEGQGGGMFLHHQENPLAIDLLVVDESSMVDLALMHALVAALPDSSHIVFLGDPQQLPSVGPGSCLADLLELPFDHHRLTTTHRNDGGILDVVTQAGHGQIDFQPRRDVTFHDGLPVATEASISAVMDHYASAVAACGGDFSKVGLLIARRKGDADTPGWNSTYLNAMLRERYNPEANMRLFLASIEGPANATKGVKIYGTRFRIDDRVIIRKNIALAHRDDPDAPIEQVVNGDTGTILDFDVERGNASEIIIALDDARVIRLPAEYIDELDIAYAMTVHSAQGSEYEQLLFICVNGTPSFVHRGIVFTAFSRAKNHLSVFGDIKVLRSVLARPAPRRNSHLVPRFRNFLSHGQRR